MKVAFLTTVFPGVEDYLDEFLSSINSQSYGDFDLVVLNDGLEHLQKYASRHAGLNIVELKVNYTIPKNREVGIKWIIDNGYDILIFGDSDDYFSDNRIESCIQKLQYSDIVVNDLHLFQADKITDNSYLSNRLTENQRLTLDMIKECNFFGMSNTAIKTKIVGDFSFDASLTAVDWYFFSMLLLNKKNKAIFTNKTFTYYRQHSNNTIGLNNAPLIEKELEVKLKNYNQLSKISTEYTILLESYKELIDKGGITRKNTNEAHPFWWESIKLS